MRSIFYGIISDMKRVYFVRHGESELNASGNWIGDNKGMTEKGKLQVYDVVKKLSHTQFDVIISSNIRRAVETGEIIKKEINKEIIFSELFNERAWPSAQVGLSKDDPESRKMQHDIWDNFSNPDYRHSDEENFSDLKTRIKKAFEFLEHIENENILVVTHGFTLRILLAYAVMGDELTGEECAQFVDKFHTKNTGVTILEYGKTARRTKWHVTSWNDHSHLF